MYTTEISLRSLGNRVMALVSGRERFGDMFVECYEEYAKYHFCAIAKCPIFNAACALQKYDI